MGSGKENIETQLNDEIGTITPIDPPKSRTSSIASDLSDLSGDTVVEGYTRSNTPDSSNSDNGEDLTQKARYMLSEEKEAAQKKFHRQLLEQVIEENSNKNKAIKHFLRFKAVQDELLGLAYFKTIINLENDIDPYEALVATPHDLKLSGMHFNELISQLLFKPFNVSALANQILTSTLFSQILEEKEAPVKTTLDDMLKDRNSLSYLHEIKEENPDLTKTELEALKKLIIVNTFLTDNTGEIQASVEALNTIYMNKKIDRKIDEKAFVYQIISNLISKIESGENILTKEENKITEYIGASNLGQTIIAIEHEKTTPEYITKDLMNILFNINQTNIINKKDDIISYIEKKTWFLNGSIFCGDAHYSNFLTSFIQALKNPEVKNDFIFELSIIKINYFIDSVPALKIMREQFNFEIEDKSQLIKIKSILKTLNPNITDHMIDTAKGSMIELFIDGLSLYDKSKDEIDAISAKLNAILGDKNLYSIENKSLSPERCVKLQEALFSRYINPNKTPPFQSLYCYAFDIKSHAKKSLLPDIASAAKNFNIFDASNKSTMPEQEKNFEVLLQKEKANYILNFTNSFIQEHKKIDGENSWLKTSKNFLKIDKSEPDIIITIAENIIKILTQDKTASIKDINKKSFPSDRLSKLCKKFITKLLSNEFNIDKVSEHLERIFQIESILHDESEQFLGIANQSMFGYSAEETLIHICNSLKVPFSAGEVIANLTKDQINYFDNKLKANISKEVLDKLNQHQVPLDELVFFFNKSENITSDAAILQSTPEQQINRVKQGFSEIADLIDNGGFAILESVGLSPKRMTTVYMPSKILELANKLKDVSNAGIDISNINFIHQFIKPYDLDVNGQYDYYGKVIHILNEITEQSPKIKEKLSTEGRKFQGLFKLNPSLEKFIQIDILNNLVNNQDKHSRDYHFLTQDYIQALDSKDNITHNVRKIRKILTNKLEGYFFFQSQKQLYEMALREIDEAFGNLNFTYNSYTKKYNFSDAILEDDGLSRLLRVIDDYGYLYSKRRNEFFANIPDNIIAKSNLTDDLKAPIKELSKLATTVLLFFYALGSAISNLFNFSKTTTQNYQKVSLDEIEIDDKTNQATTRMLKELSGTMNDVEENAKEIDGLNQLADEIALPDPRQASVLKIIENYNNKIKFNEMEPNLMIDVDKLRSIIPILANEDSTFLDIFINEDAYDYLPTILKQALFGKVDKQLPDEIIIKDLNLLIETSIETLNAEARSYKGTRN